MEDLVTKTIDHLGLSPYSPMLIYPMAKLRGRSITAITLNLNAIVFAPVSSVSIAKPSQNSQQTYTLHSATSSIAHRIPSSVPQTPPLK
jgi:hypothetical protein